MPTVVNTETNAAKNKSASIAFSRIRRPRRTTSRRRAAGAAGGDAAVAAEGGTLMSSPEYPGRL